MVILGGFTMKICPDCKAIIYTSATPAVDGEVIARIIQNNMRDKSGCFVGWETCYTAADAILALFAAQPASTLRGTDNPLRAYSVEQLQFELAIRATWKFASLPEQPAAEDK